MLENLYCTVGCHPTRCLEFEANTTKPEIYLQDLKETIELTKSKVVGIGECGLDYDRIQFCPKDIQKKYVGALKKITLVFILSL